MEQTELNGTTADTIVALATPPGTGGIAVVRLSGPDAVAIADSVWRGKSLSDVASHTAHLGEIIGEDGNPIDMALVTVFRGPHSFTGEDTVEFSLHGSRWIQRTTVARLTAAGARAATAGEFTRRACLNNRLDLAQAEAVADLIAAESKAAHRLAMTQMSGSFSRKLESLRERLVELASLLELELDFSEEEVEFADRSRLLALVQEVLDQIDRLVSTYRAGKAFKEGVPVAIAGRPNAGKSTLLNRLLGEDRAIVSDIPGTTRDVIEDTREINGILFRFFDTAGLRETDDTVEQMGIDRAMSAIDRAAIVLWTIDATDTANIAPELAEVRARKAANPDSTYMVLLNKSDLSDAGQDTAHRTNPAEDPEFSCEVGQAKENSTELIRISAKSGTGCDTLETMLSKAATREHDPEQELIVTNERHLAAMRDGSDSLRRVKEGLASGLPTDLVAQDLREATRHLAAITGTITTPTLLSTIFSRFCIGK